MKLTKKDKFAMLPKRCNKCNTLFIFEWYNNYYKIFGIGDYHLEQVKCKRCVEKVG